MRIANIISNGSLVKGFYSATKGRDPIAAPKIVKTIELHNLFEKGNNKGVIAHLSDQQFSDIDLSGVSLCAAHLPGLDIASCNIQNSNFFGSVMFDSKIVFTNASSVDFSYAVMRRSSIENSNVSKSMFCNSDLRWSVLDSVKMAGTNFSGADFRYSELINVDLTQTRLNRSVGNMKNIKSMQIEDFEVVYTKDTLCIGDVGSRIFEWERTRGVGFGLNKQMTTFVEKWLGLILKIIEMSPALATGFVEEESENGL